MKRILYVTSTRADYGLMAETLQTLNQSAQINLSILVTGTHLEQEYGNTISEIRNTGLNCVAQARTYLHSINRQGLAEMALRTGNAVMDELTRNHYDIVLLLGDRIEILGAATAAFAYGTAVYHIGGGERSGTIDESIRHAISKLSHLHFVSTHQSRDRLIRMGEEPSNIVVCGAPGLVGICDRVSKQSPIGESRSYALVVYHPVVQDWRHAAGQMRNILLAVRTTYRRGMIVYPNADTGSKDIVDEINMFCKNNAGYEMSSSLPRDTYLTYLAHAGVLVGNSSSGIIEAASFGTPVVNVGERQRMRERNKNVYDVENSVEKLVGLLNCVKPERCTNIYGDGTANIVIEREIAQRPVVAETFRKINTY